MEEREPTAADDAPGDASTDHEPPDPAPSDDEPPQPADPEQRADPGPRGGEPDLARYGSDGRCRPHGNPWRCPRCLADVSDVPVFNNT
ncbi:MAG: hypothetical protein GEV07_08685 [Streptosporangiales bacterium]|nr:hypothetical protein [Streptosporangiales bacterium]